MTIVALALCSLTACGGGGTEPPAQPIAAVATISVSAASSATSDLLAASTDPISTGAPAVSAYPVRPVAAAPEQESNVSTVGTARALSASASLSLGGVPERPAIAPPLSSTISGGRVFYVDSRNGDDALNGRASNTTIGTPVGPWRTLARVEQSDLSAGDTLVLACGSVWQESLRLPASGNSTRPVTVTAPAVGCATKPAIDGSLQIDAAEWTQHRGRIYKATLDRAPLQLFADSGVMNEAHHPNRGHIASDPTNPYALVTANGDTINTGNSNAGSIILNVGTDLSLPAGASPHGARVRVRTTSWLMDERVVSAMDGSKMILSSPTSYPLRAGAGYLLLGQLWMLDSAGEWHYDAASKLLYVWLPDSAVPGTAAVGVSVLPVGVDLNGRSNIVLDGLAIRRVGSAIQMRASQNVRVRNSVIEDVGDLGADAAFSNGAAFESNTFARIGQDAISGHDDLLGYSTGMTVKNNVIRDSGVIVSGDGVQSLPRRSRAAVLPGRGSTVSGNVIINAGYIGIRPNANSVVENNFVFGSCSVLDDCAGIYVWQDRDIVIRSNTVMHTRGERAGKPASEQFTQGQGIYLDESTTAIRIEDNTLIDNDHGIHIHVSANNTVRGNRLYGNRISQIWMQETGHSSNASGAVFGNSVTRNQIAAVRAGSAGLLLQTVHASTASFGSFEDNRYYDRVSTAAVVANTAADTRAYTVDQWQRSRGVGSTGAVDATGGGVGNKGYTTYTVNGANLVHNSGLLQNSAGWSIWNLTEPAGQLSREPCPAGTCLRYVAGGSPGLVSTPNFSIVRSQWYRLSVDLATEQDAQAVQLVVRRGGGGNNGYESLSDRVLTVNSTRSWGRYSVVFQATASVTAGNAATGDLGARIDIESIVPGRSVSLSNMELVPIEMSALAQISGSIVNVGPSSMTTACPFANSQPALCGKLFDLADDQNVVWPLTVAPNRAIILYAQEASLIDSDGDGIADSQDRCPSTAYSAFVNASGCSFEQR